MADGTPIRPAADPTERQMVEAREIWERLARIWIEQGDEGTAEGEAMLRYALAQAERRGAEAERNRLHEAVEMSATMLAIWGPETFPEVNEHGQIHFARALMESAAESLFLILPPEAKARMEAKRAEIAALDHEPLAPPAGDTAPAADVRATTKD